MVSATEPARQSHHREARSFSLAPAPAANHGRRTDCEGWLLSARRRRRLSMPPDRAPRRRRERGTPAAFRLHEAGRHLGTAAGDARRPIFQRQPESFGVPKGPSLLSDRRCVPAIFRCAGRRWLSATRASWPSPSCLERALMTSGRRAGTTGRKPRDRDRRPARAIPPTPGAWRARNIPHRPEAP